MTVKVYDSFTSIGPVVSHADYLSLAAENSSLRLTIDNIVNALKLGDGPVSQQVIELVTGLVAENLALLEKSEDVYAAGYNHGHLHTADGIAYTQNVEDDFYESALRVIAEVETPTTDAAIAEIKAQGIDWLIETVSPEWLESYVQDAKRLAVTLRAGGKG